MPGKKHMNQDRPVDGQDTLQTMQDKKSGIYQDRTDGKLPQGRVAQHYQDMDAKMEQEYTGSNPIAKRMHAEAKTKAAAKAKKDAENKANDSIFNDSANDGNMVSRALRKAESYLPGPSGQGGNTTFGISKKL
mgnify:CR=1 FL=1